MTKKCNKMEQYSWTLPHRNIHTIHTYDILCKTYVHKILKLDKNNQKLPKWGFSTCIIYLIFISAYGNCITIFSKQYFGMTYSTSATRQHSTSATSATYSTSATSAKCYFNLTKHYLMHTFSMLYFYVSLCASLCAVIKLLLFHKVTMNANIIKIDKIYF